MSVPVDPEADTVPGPEPEALARVLRGVRPGNADVAAAVARARIASALFGEAEPVRIGRYVVESQAGAGGGGLVLAARDPELARRVAIKLVHGDQHDRMLAEGQALAKLSHPNVVPVYDVGVHGDQVYVVMELVEGQTLRDYCAPPRTVRDVVRAYRQAGEGLAAAHRAGFVHRDFKPDNALIGADGRVRVVDFGLARAGDPMPGPAGPLAVGSVPVTHAGLGTPRYMSPEQTSGAVLTPATDQYAFCVSLREGLLAVAPAAPRWLDEILRRGAAAVPEHRFPSMERLLGALALDPATRWRRRAFVGGALGLATAAFVVGRADRAEPAACDLGAAEIEAAWNAPARDTLRAHLAALGTPYASRAGDHVTGSLDAYGARWRALHREGCLAHRDATLSTPMYDRRVACLTRARAAFEAAIGAVSSTTAERLPDAIVAAAQLPDLGRCTDPELLMAGAPPPPDTAAAVAELSNELASLEVQVRAARPGVRSRVADAAARARTLRHPPLLARALRLTGFAALAAGDRPAAIAPLGEATRLALTAGEPALAVEAYARRAHAEATTAAASGALSGLELVEAIAAGLPDSERAVRALLDNNVGTVELAAGRHDRARAAFERALGHARAVTGPAALELAVVRTNLALVASSPAQRVAIAREHRAIVEAALDGGHPMVLEARFIVALLEPDAVRARAALASTCAAYVELQPAQQLKIFECEYELGMLAYAMGDAAVARRAFGVAAAAEPGDEIRTRLALARGYRTLLDGDLGDAARQVDELIRRIGPTDALPWWDQLNAGDAWLLRGSIARAAGQAQAAGAAFEAARRLLEPVVAKQDSPHYERRLERARAELAAPR